MRHVSSSSGVATLRTAIHLLLTYFTWKQTDDRFVMLSQSPSSGLNVIQFSLTKALLQIYSYR